MHLTYFLPCTDNFLYPLALQMWMNVESMDRVHNTPPARTPLVPTCVHAMMALWRMEALALVRDIHTLDILSALYWQFPPTSCTTDVDECRVNGSCPQHSTCTNTFGSYLCTCNDGFVKNESTCIGKGHSHTWHTFCLVLTISSNLLHYRCGWMSSQWIVSTALHLQEHLWLLPVHMQWWLCEEWKHLHW